MDIAETSFKRNSTVARRWVWLGRAWYSLKAAWRHVRVSRLATRVLGPQYRRSRDMIEIDITYACNLHCRNCNRSVTQAPERKHMPLEMVQQFVRESISREKMWRRIRVLGGEPTLHPALDSIVQELQAYCDWNPSCRLEIVTNGYGRAVESKLAALPRNIWVENSRKTSVIQPTFGPFNLAPCDDPRYSHADYSNGCAIMSECGMGLTPTGYYPCAVAGGIDRITNDGLGSDTLPDDSDDMLDAARQLCRLCGRFRAGHFVPHNLRPPLLGEEVSPSWDRLYAEWRVRNGRAGTSKVDVTVRGERAGVDDDWAEKA
tara:strand:- start:3478 stop:4428 length:951 start_codon:yes stop_codon:yes gene_type:complete